MSRLSLHNNRFLQRGFFLRMQLSSKSVVLSAVTKVYTEQGSTSLPLPKCAAVSTLPFIKNAYNNLTWMKYLPHRHGEVSLRFKVLRHGGVVSRMDPPVGVEVVEPGCVRSATGQQGRTTGSTHSLLEEEKKKHFQTFWRHNITQLVLHRIWGYTHTTPTHLCICVEKNLAFGCQLVDVRGFCHSVPVAAQWCPQIIRYDEQHISPLWKQNTTTDK